jgi:hypothetical protein
MDRKTTLTGLKKAYEPPRLATINLRPEEAVLGACKTTTGTSPVCNEPCASFICKNVGS